MALLFCECSVGEILFQSLVDPFAEAFSGATEESCECCEPVGCHCRSPVDARRGRGEWVTSLFGRSYGDAVLGGAAVLRFWSVLDFLSGSLISAGDSDFSSAARVRLLGPVRAVKRQRDSWEASM